MNQTMTGCANCYYYSNGMCFYGAKCYGTYMVSINGVWVSVPINDTNFEVKYDE